MNDNKDPIKTRWNDILVGHSKIPPFVQGKPWVGVNDTEASSDGDEEVTLSVDTHPPNALEKICGPENVSDDFAILLNEYPLIKKFGALPEFNYDTLFRVFYNLHRRVNFVYDTIDHSLSPKFLGRLEDFYETHRGIIEPFVRSQLIKSGILNTLNDIPLVPPGLNEGAQKKIMFSVFIIMPGGKLLENPYHHRDGALFHIITYADAYHDCVLGSEIEFFPDISVKKHPNVAKGVKPVDFYNYAGPSLDAALTNVNQVYTRLRETSVDTVSLRILLNKYDTLVFSDILLIHGLLDDNEIITDEEIGGANKKFAQITVHGDAGNNSIPLKVAVCDKRFDTKDFNRGRSIISLRCIISSDVGDKNISPHLTFLLYPDPVDRGDVDIDILNPYEKNAINLTNEDMVGFLTRLSANDHNCAIIEGSGIFYKPRGGKF